MTMTKKSLKFKLLTIAATIISLSTLTGIKQQTIAMNNGIITSQGDLVKENYFKNKAQELYKNVKSEERKPGDSGTWKLNSPQDFQKLRDTYPDVVKTAIEETNKNIDDATVKKLVIDKLNEQVYFEGENITNKEKLVRLLYNYALEHNGNIVVLVVNHGGGYGLPESITTLHHERKANDFSVLVTEKMTGAQEENNRNHNIPIDTGLLKNRNWNETDFLMFNLTPPDKSIPEVNERNSNYMAGFKYTIAPEIKPVEYINGKPVYDSHFAAADNVKLFKYFLEEMVGIVNEANDRLKKSEEFEEGELESLEEAADSVAKIKDGKVSFPKNARIDYIEINNNDAINLYPWFTSRTEPARIDKLSEEKLGTQTKKIDDELIGNGFTSVDKIEERFFQSDNKGAMSYFNPNHDEEKEDVMLVSGYNNPIDFSKYIATKFVKTLNDLDEKTPDNELIKENGPVMPTDGRVISKIAEFQGKNTGSIGTFIEFTDNIDICKKIFDPNYSKHLARLCYKVFEEAYGKILLKNPSYEADYAKIILEPLKFKDAWDQEHIGIVVKAELFGTNFKRNEIIDRIKNHKITLDVVIWNSKIRDADGIVWPTGKKDKIDVEEGNRLTHKHTFLPETEGWKNTRQRINLTPGREKNNEYDIDVHVKYWNNDSTAAVNQFVFSNLYSTTIKEKPDKSLYLENNQVVKDPAIRKIAREYDKEYAKKIENVTQLNDDNKEVVITVNELKPKEAIKNEQKEEEIKTDETKKLDTKKLDDGSKDENIKHKEAEKLSVEENKNNNNIINQKAEKLSVEENKDNNNIINQKKEKDEDANKNSTNNQTSKQNIEEKK